MIPRRIALVALIALSACETTPPKPAGPSPAERRKAAAGKADQALALASKNAAAAEARQKAIAAALAKEQGPSKARLARLVEEHGKQIFAGEAWKAAQAKLKQARIERGNDQYALATEKAEQAGALFSARLERSEQLEAALVAREAAQAGKASWRELIGMLNLPRSPELTRIEAAEKQGEALFEARDYGKAAAALQGTAEAYAGLIKAAEPSLLKASEEHVAALTELVGKPLELLARYEATPKSLRALSQFAALARDKQLWTLVVTAPQRQVVALRLIDPASGLPVGAPHELGATPLSQGFLAPARYQLELRGAGEPRLLPIDLRRKSASRRLVLTLPAPQTGMAYVPAVSGLTASAGPRDFWIDRDEVSRAQLAAYLAATGDFAPPGWPLSGEMPAGTDKQPVLGLSAQQAIYYALWAGKRLPWRDEWMRAATGGAERPYPWGAESSAETHVVAAFGKRPLPVGGRAAGQSPYGVRDMSGNAAEFALPTVAAQRGRYLLLGGSFLTSAAAARLDAKLRLDAGKVGQPDAGLRCARSALVDAAGEPLTPEQGLAQESLGVVLEAMAQLARRGDDAARALLYGQLADAEPLIQMAAAFHLANVAPATLKAFLEPKLSADDEATRRGALRVLIEPPLRRHDAFLAEVVASESSVALRLAGYERLASWPRPALAAAFAAGLEDKEPRIRAVCLQALGLIPSEAHLAAVKGRLADPDANVRQLAALCLCQWRRADAASAVLELIVDARDARMRQQLLAHLALLGPDAVIEACNALLARPQGRAPALQILGLMGAVEKVDVMLDALENPQLKSAAIFGLSQLRTDRGNQVLSDLLPQRGLPAGLRLHIATMLAESGHAAAVPKLASLLQRGDVQGTERATLLELLARIGTVEAQKICQQAVRSSPTIPTLKAFARSGHPQAASSLLDAVERAPADQRLTMQCLAALASERSVKGALLEAMRARGSWSAELELLASGLGTILSWDELMGLLRSDRLIEQLVGAAALLETPRELVPAALASQLAQMMPEAQLRLLLSLRERRAHELIEALEVLLKARIDPVLRASLLQTQAVLLRTRRRVDAGGYR